MEGRETKRGEANGTAKKRRETKRGIEAVEVGYSCRVASRRSTRGIPASETGREKSVGASIRRPMTSSVFCLESFSRQKPRLLSKLFGELSYSNDLDFSSNLSGFRSARFTVRINRDSLASAVADFLHVRHLFFPIRLTNRRTLWKFYGNLKLLLASWEELY